MTSRRPTLAWATDVGTDGAHVEICRDRACTNLLVDFDAAGNSAAAPRDLSAGVVFWRVSSTRGGVRGEASYTWQFMVGARSAPVATTWGSTFDVNGDGFADLLVGAPNTAGGAGSAFLYIGGGSSRPPSIARPLPPPPVSGNFGWSVASAGDVNGDGFADAIVGAWAADGGGGRAYIYLGGANGLSTTPIGLAGPDGGNFGWSVSGVGDVNRDGFGDVVITAVEAQRAYIYLGMATGVSFPPIVLVPAAASNFGEVGAGAGDLDGDGYADVAIGAPRQSATTGQVYLYFGGPSGPATAPSATVVGPPGMGEFGGRVTGAGDVNGDGYSDLLVSSSPPYVYLGGASRELSASLPIALGPQSPGGMAFVGTATAAGDVDGDGYSDLFAVSQPAAGAAPIISVYFGGASPFLTSSRGFAFDLSTFAGAGDVNGDGRGDLLVGSPDKGVTLFYGAQADGLNELRASRFGLPDGLTPGDDFGAALASRGVRRGPCGTARVWASLVERARLF